MQSFDTQLMPAGGKSTGGGGGLVNQGGGAPAGGGGAGGNQGPPTARPRLSDDFYFVQQHTTLLVPTELGLLSNDVPVNLKVGDQLYNHDVERPSEFDVDLHMQDDGSFSFAAAEANEFFGVYRFRYNVKTADGRPFDTDAGVQVRVIPTHVNLEVVRKGVGGFVIYGPEGSSLGSALDRGTDIDRDGRRDLLLGAPGTNGGQGAAFVVFGKVEHAAVRLDVEPPEADPAPYAVVLADSMGLGSSATWVGDIDRDGTAEAAIATSAGTGLVYVVPGAALHGSVQLDQMPPPSTSVIQPPLDEEIGRIVRGVGDVDGDAFPDLVFSAKRAASALLYLFSGGTRSITPYLLGADGDPEFPITCTGPGDLDGDGAAEVFVASANDFLLLRGVPPMPEPVSWPVAYVSDFTTDGRSRGWIAARSGSGAAAVASLQDVNGDGSADLGTCDEVGGGYVCSVIFGPPTVLLRGWTFSGFSSMAERVTISGGGDVDGDGLADILLSDGATAYVVYGRRAGHEPVNLSGLKASEGFTVSPAEGSTITSAAIVGDVNGDRIADLAFGDANADGGAGRVYVVFGVSSS